MGGSLIHLYGLLAVVLSFSFFSFVLFVLACPRATSTMHIVLCVCTLPSYLSTPDPTFHTHSFVSYNPRILLIPLVLTYDVHYAHSLFSPFSSQLLSTRSGSLAQTEHTYDITKLLSLIGYIYIIADVTRPWYSIVRGNTFIPSIHTY